MFYLIINLIILVDNVGIGVFINNFIELFRKYKLINYSRYLIFNNNYNFNKLGYEFNI